MATNQTKSDGFERQAKLPGFEQFNQDTTDTRAQVDIYKADPNNRKAVVIRIMRGADRSTVPHELAHVFFGEMRDYVMSGQADEATRADFMRLCKWAGPLTVPPDLAPEELEAAQAAGAAVRLFLWTWCVQSSSV